MIDFDPLTACRICLEDGALYPIFESNEDFESIHAKLADCLKEKIVDIEGFPRYICLKCKNTSETINSFLNKFEESNKILLSNVVTVKSEFLHSFDFSDDDNVMEPFEYELQIDNILKVEPEPEKENKRKDPTELLGSLKHLTIKKIKVDNNSERKDSNCTDIENAKKQKQVQPHKTKKTVSKKVMNESQQQSNNGLSKIKKTAIRSVKKEAVRKINLSQQRQEVESGKNKKADDKSAKLCDLCGSTFDTVLKLAKHRKTVHTERKYICTKCNKAYVRKKELNDHVLQTHEKVKNFTCDTCGKGFFLRKTLIEHILIVHKKVKRRRSTIYKCKYCDRSYHYKRGITIHERSVHTGERPSTCSVCGSSFYDHVYLAEHMRIHTGDTPYKCPVCGRGYAQRGNMKSHMRNHKISEIDADTLSKLEPKYLKFMRP